MAKNTFITLSSSIDDILVEKEDSMKKAAKEIAAFYAGKSGDTVSTDIDKLLKNFSDHDKYVIMKYAFLRMI